MDYKQIPDIIERNKKALATLIDEYEMPRTLEQLLSRFERVVMNFDMNTKRLRLLGVERYSENAKQVYEDLGEGITEERIVVPTKQIQLFVLKKNQIEKMDSDEIQNIKLKLSCFVDLYNQIRSANSILVTEQNSINVCKKWNIIQ